MFRRILFFGAAALVAAACAKDIDPELKTEPKENPSEQSVSNYEPGVAVVKLSDELTQLVEEDLNEGKLATKSMGLNQALDELSITSMTRLFPYAGEYEPRTRAEGLHRWYVVKYNTDVAMTKASSELSSIPGIEIVEGQHKIVTDSFNDPRLKDQWGYINPGTSKNYKKGADINVSEVWEKFTTGNPNVIVGVIDGGIDLTHPDLRANCIEGGENGSFNFVDGTTKIVAHDHGTHVAGTIAAVNNNGIGVCGIAGGDAANGKEGVKLLSCQIFKTVNGKDEGGSTSSALKWAADHGAVIANNSWGYSADTNNDGTVSPDELEAYKNTKISAYDKAAIDYFIKYAGCDNNGNQNIGSPMKGGVVIFSAGNSAIEYGIPASYEPVVAVGAIGPTGNKAYYTSYGSWVDICAPGGDSNYSTILSTLPGSKYGSMQGTSMACPHVTGVAALIVSYFGGQGFTADQLKAKLLGGEKKDFVSSTYKIGNLVDALGSMFYNMGNVPSVVKSYSSTSNSNNIVLSWSQTKDSKGFDAYGYRLLLSKDKSELEKVDVANPGKGIVTLDVDVPEGTASDAELSGTFKDLEFDTEYYVGISSRNYQKEYSKISAIKPVRTGINNPPVIKFDNASVTQKAYQTVKYAMSVYDPDGHSFTMSIVPGSDAASLASDNSGVIIDGTKAKAGKYTATITATDSFGAHSSAEFTYTIEANQAPVKIKDLDNVYGEKVGDSFRFDASDYFSDPDGEDLSYSVEADNPNLIYLNHTGSEFIGTFLSTGASMVTVKAYDALGASVSTTFGVIVREKGVEVEAYPNPVVDKLYIRTGNEKQSTTLKLYSSTGAEVLNITHDSSVFDPLIVDVTKLAPGRYKAEITFGGKSYEKQIIKR